MNLPMFVPDRQRRADLRRYWQQWPWRARMAWHHGRAEYHKLRGDYWAILNDARRGEVIPLTADDQRQLSALFDQVGARRGEVLTPYQLLDVVRHAPDVLAAKLIARWQKGMDEASSCIELNHQGRIERYQREANERFLAEAATRG